ncbi:hypothetical protein [Nocardia salmonicida]|uniref:hypothetical protein n=1 Tax=Nocardia salmonicida TaxID=53431 RepID=UPI0013F4CBAE|nr:hypothetical protein [Nocardia salmonicida]
MLAGEWQVVLDVVGVNWQRAEVATEPATPRGPPYPCMVKRGSWRGGGGSQ